MNVLFVMSDTFRYDSLSCYAPTEVKTPHLDQFAQDSYVFDNAYLGSFPTMPNRLDIMSGRFSFIDHEWCPLPKETVTLQQVLGVSGVVTQMIADNPHLLEAGFNYDRGFQGFEWIRGQELDTWRTAPKDVKLPEDGSPYRRPNLILPVYLRNTAWWKSEEDRFVARTMKAACQWLEENQDQDQFFLYIDTFDPHEPWDAPKKYVDLYDPDYEGEDIIYPRYDFWREFLTEEELNHIRALYMAEATMVDHWFGVLMNKVEELGLTEDTAVIFTSDHGYLFGEHDLTGKSLIPTIDGTHTAYEAIRMYDEIRRVPLLIRLPDHAGGQHIDALVQSPDLMPTILEMVGLVASEAVAGQSHAQALQCGVLYAEDWEFKPEDIHGKSLMPLMRGEMDRLRDVVVSSNTLIHHTPILAKCSVVTEDGWCLHYAGQYQEVSLSGKMYLSQLIHPEASRITTQPGLYYLPDDPDEENDIIHENEGLAREIHERYVGWLEEAGTPEEHLVGRRSLR